MRWGFYDLTLTYQSLYGNDFHRRVPNGTHGGGVSRRRLVTAAYSVGIRFQAAPVRRQLKGAQSPLQSTRYSQR